MDSRTKRTIQRQMPVGFAGVTVIVTLSIFAASSSADAGEMKVDGWYVVSRSCAPAGAQESITYLPFNRRILWTASVHYDAQGRFLHVINTYAKSPSTQGWEYTWRSYAGHFGTEFWYGQVVGYHWASDIGFTHQLAATVASNCNIGSSAPGSP